MHYSGDIGLTSGMFQEAYHEVFKMITHRKLYENWPIEYIMDDHDVGADDADGTHSSTLSANAAYRAVIPHYPLPEEVETEREE